MPAKKAPKKSPSKKSASLPKDVKMPVKLTEIKEPDKMIRTHMTSMEIHYPEKLEIFYANHASLSMSPTDLSIDFGVRHNQPVDGKIKSTIQISSRVIMSPQHAKVFLSKVKEVIDAYEEDFGNIKTEPQK